MQFVENISQGDFMNYDGTTPVAIEIAKLYGYSANSQATISKKMKEARTALNVGDARKLSVAQNMAIFEYHKNNRKAVEDNSHVNTDIVEYIQQPIIEPVEDIQQSGIDFIEYVEQQGVDSEELAQLIGYDAVEYNSQTIVNVVEDIQQVVVENISHPINDSVENVSQINIEHVEDNSQVIVEDIQQAINQPVEDISQPCDPDKLARVAFYTSIDGVKKRQVIALHGFMINALLAAIGSPDKSEAPKWLNNQPFVSDKSITLQVQKLIVKELTK